MTLEKLIKLRQKLIGNIKDDIDSDEFEYITYLLTCDIIILHREKQPKKNKEILSKEFEEWKRLFGIAEEKI